MKCINENNNAFCPELIHRKMIDFFDRLKSGQEEI